MYYSNGNYEAFARPRKPAHADEKSAWIVGGGLAGLAAAVFLIRDAQVPGDGIHVLEEAPLAGGSLDGTDRPSIGFITRGGREMENHFECLWDMYRSIPSLEIEGASYLDEYYWLDKDDPNSSNCRLIHDRGDRVASDGAFTLTDGAQEEIAKLFVTAESESRRQDHRGVLLRGLLREQLLDLLGHHVRLREMALPRRDAPLPPAVRPPHRRPARLQRPEVQPLQPVRVDGQADPGLPA